MKTNEDRNTSSSEDVIDHEDEDICTPKELNKLFKHKYIIHDEPDVAFEDSYILKLAKDDSFTCIAAGLSDGTVRLFEVNSEKGLHIKPPMSDGIRQKTNICGLRFVDETPNLLLVGNTNGLVRLLDLRTPGEVATFKNVPASSLEPIDIGSCDSNANGRLLCMGTLQKGNNVNLLFYDMRSSNQLFRYLESHQDDITSLRFHPQNPDYLCTGSTDGLINIYDVTEQNEDDAILTTVNTEDTVHKINWHKNSKGQDIVSCITHTNSFKSYEFDGDLIAEFDRLKLTKNIKRKNESNFNLIDCHSTKDNALMLIAGTNSNNGAILRSCKIQNDHILPYANLEGNKQIVRESIFDAKTEIFITAGESGLVTLWTPQSWNNLTTKISDSTSSGNLKIKNKKSNKFAPY